MNDDNERIVSETDLVLSKVNIQLNFSQFYVNGNEKSIQINNLSLKIWMCKWVNVFFLLLLTESLGNFNQNFSEVNDFAKRKLRKNWIDKSVSQSL